MQTDLSKRLRKIAKEVPPYARIADIGTDHGYLPVHLIKKGRVSWALAADINRGPLQTAVTRIKNENLENYIETRQGNGLQVIRKDDAVDTIIIAGMGGPLITEILKEGSYVLSTVKRLILQPNIHAAVIRKWLAANHWKLVNEHIVEEDGRIYEILVADQGDGEQPYKSLAFEKEAGYLFGPYLLKEQSPAFMKKWRIEEKKWLSVLKELEKATSVNKTNEKKAELQRKVSLLREVLEDEGS